MEEPDRHEDGSFPWDPLHKEEAGGEKEGHASEGDGLVLLPIPFPSRRGTTLRWKVFREVSHRPMREDPLPRKKMARR